MPADNIVARDEGGTFERPPADGYSAVCVDVIDLGYFFDPKWKKVTHRCAIVWQLDCRDSKGKLFEIAQRYTVSMGEKAYLRRDLSAWRGKSYTDEEAKAGAPLAKLVGVPAYITVEHNKSGDKTYANVVGITKLPKGLTPLEPENYVRSEHWKKGDINEAEKQKFAAQGIEDAAKSGGSPQSALTPTRAMDSDFDDFTPESLEEADDLPF